MMCSSTLIFLDGPKNNMVMCTHFKSSNFKFLNFENRELCGAKYMHWDYENDTLQYRGCRTTSSVRIGLSQA